jgi:branched-subunit amino acid aminotransferase/4-amino-4-deoxychorismate lyase
MLDTPDVNLPTRLAPERAEYWRSLAYADGAFLPLAQATVSMRDHGFMYADMTYDVLQVWRGGIFRMDAHLDRFFASMAGLRLDPPLTRAALTEVLKDLVRRSGLADALLYVTCTRGEGPLGTRDPRLARPRVLANIQPLVLRGSPDEFRRGWHATIVEGVRRIPADSVNPVWKNSHWGDLSRAQWIARDGGFDTAILLDHAGKVTEGPGFNVVAVTRDGLLTPDSGVLEGIACRALFDVAADLGVRARFGTLSPEALRGADEAFVTMTSTGLFPITRLDGAPVGHGRPGPVSVRLFNELMRRKDAGWDMTPVIPGGTTGGNA